MAISKAYGAALDQLAERAAGIALRAAAEYFRTRIDVSDERLIGRLVDELRAEVKAAIGAAMDDCREAFAAGMPAEAELSFRLDMAAAGIRAAKRVCEVQS